MEACSSVWFSCGLGSPLLTAVLLFVLCIFQFVWAAVTNDPTKQSAFIAIAWGLFAWSAFLFLGFGFFGVPRIKCKTRLQ